jgi:hypothetical protein
VEIEGHDDAVRRLVDYCAGLGGIYEVAVGTAASDPHFVSCAVTVSNETLATRLAAAAPTIDEAVEAVMSELRRAALSATSRSRLERLPSVCQEVALEDREFEGRHF